jgi:Alr-MurF fusion protein
MLSVAQLVHIIGATLPAKVFNNKLIKHLCIDSRQIVEPKETVFFAIRTKARDGHQFIDEVYNKGVHLFIVENIPPNSVQHEHAVFLIVPSVVKALQQIGAYKRSKHHKPVIGITGSNGKTIVKEWLYTMLHKKFSITKSPQSFNSQIGVPLSVWKLHEQTDIGIFEAGISTTHEMDLLQHIIQPTIGIFTHLGTAHKEGFISDTEKLLEKWKLFKNALVVIAEDKSYLHNTPGIDIAKLKTWGTNGNFFTIKLIEANEHNTIVSGIHNNTTITFTIPFVNKVFVENALHVICTCLWLALPVHEIQQGLYNLEPVEMRLSIKEGINNCTIINDAYTNDIEAFQYALEALLQHKDKQGYSIIMSDVEEGNSILYTHIIGMLQYHTFKRITTIGKGWEPYTQILTAAPYIKTYVHENSTHDFIARFLPNHYSNEAILLKGARKHSFERIAGLLELKHHQTWVTINLEALTQNINTIRSAVPGGTAIMAMVKASSYGAGTSEIAAHLTYNKVDYLAVAYLDEAIELRNKGIQLPIMVMNPEFENWGMFLKYNIEPEIYSFELFNKLIDYCQKNDVAYFPVHIKFDTGMHRLGFDITEATDVISVFESNSFLKIQSLFSHLASADNPLHDKVTQKQLNDFEKIVTQFTKKIHYPFFKHIANSAGAMRNNPAYCNMVRLGLAMYGINPLQNHTTQLVPVLSFYTTIAQIKHIKTGETVGYGLSYTAKRNTTIATVRVGYADGYPRNLSNGAGYMLIHNQQAFVCGKVCMDMVMLDVTDIPNAAIGDVVTIIGEGLSATTLATLSNTIAYEIITGISNRVSRLYIK